MDIYSRSGYQLLPDACVYDVTVPTFSGISGLTQVFTGALNATWSAASDSSTPIRYNVYVQKTTATGLFSLDPFITYGTSINLYEDSNGNRLESGATYYVGVRAVDAVGNMETNTTSLSAISLGVLSGEIHYECFATLSVNASNELQGFLFLNGDGKAIKTLLGTANFSIYDESDTIMGVFTQTGLTANANGIYLLTPVTAVSLDPFTHYRARIVIVHNSVSIESYVGFIIGE